MMTLVEVFSFASFFLQVKSVCLSDTCQKISLDVHRDAVQDSKFIGHVFHSSKTLSPVQCYMWCIEDCRCLSFNYNDTDEGKFCELNEANHFTHKSSLKPSLGSTYYNLRRDDFIKVGDLL